MVMMFMVEEARLQLQMQGYVYTFRTKRRKLGKDWANTGRGTPKFADIEVVEEVKVNSEFDLDRFTKGSGFPTRGRWEGRIRRLHPEMAMVKGWIYKAVLGEKTVEDKDFNHRKC